MCPILQPSVWITDVYEFGFWGRGEDWKVGKGEGLPILNRVGWVMISRNYFIDRLPFVRILMIYSNHSLVLS